MVAKRGKVIWTEEVELSEGKIVDTRVQVTRVSHRPTGAMKKMQEGQLLPNT